MYSFPSYFPSTCLSWLGPLGTHVGTLEFPGQVSASCRVSTGRRCHHNQTRSIHIFVGWAVHEKNISFQCSGFMIFIGPLALPKSLNISLWISLKRPSATCTLRQYTYNSLSFWSDWLHWACFGIQICWIPVESEHWQSKPPVNESSTDKALDVHHLQDIEQMGTTRSNGWFTKGIQRVAIDW